jgi:undecaprenyl-diphosphatase
MLEQFILIAVIQGITEFLPISSVAHVNLLHLLTPLEDQGLVLDVAVHLGSVVAVIAYNWPEIKQMTMSVLSMGRLYRNLFGVSLAAIIATIPAVIAGFFLNSNEMVIEAIRNVEIIAWATLLFGILLGIADRHQHRRRFQTTNMGDALIIGIAQILAFIPGTSRAGITMTAGLFCGLSRRAAARFSMILSIPVILGSALLKSRDIISYSEQWAGMLIAAGIAMIVAFLAIGAMMAIIQRVGFMPFVIYRVILGLVLLGTVYLI